MLPRQVIKGFPEKDETRCFVVHGSVKSNAKRRDETRREYLFILSLETFTLRIQTLFFSGKTRRDETRCLETNFTDRGLDVFVPGFAWIDCTIPAMISSAYLDVNIALSRFSIS